MKWHVLLHNNNLSKTNKNINKTTLEPQNQYLEYQKKDK